MDSRARGFWVGLLLTVCTSFSGADDAQIKDREERQTDKSYKTEAEDKRQLGISCPKVSGQFK